MFEPGQSGNPRGRPKGSYGGRIQALAGLDRLLARKKNQNAMIRALEAELQADPVRFFRSIVMPLLPKESKLSVDREGVIQWKSLLGGEAEKRCEPPTPTGFGAPGVEGGGCEVAEDREVTSDQ